MVHTENRVDVDRPNIVLVITHDTGQHLGCYGASVETPRLDELGAAGIRFENYMCTAAQCTPSRSSIVTGRFPHDNGLMGLAHLGWRLRDDEVCLGEHLTRAGYDTYLAGFQHEDPDPKRLGYQDILETSRLAADVGASVASFIQNRSQGESKTPFFVMAGFEETHRPFDSPRYTPDDPDEIEAPEFLPDVPAVREELAQFQGLVKAVDQGVGTMIDALDATDLSENTIFIYTTDHGIAFPRAKGMSYEAGLKTALLIRWPDQIKRSQVREELISNVDLLPTLLEAAGAPPPSNLAGRSFLPLLAGRPYTPRDHVHFEMTWHDRYNPMRGIRTTRYKYIRNFDPTSPRVYLPADIYISPSGQATRDAYYADCRPTEELYDLAEDPLEMENLIGRDDVAGVEQDLKQRVDHWLRASRDPILKGPPAAPRAQAEHLAEYESDERKSGPLRSVERQLMHDAIGESNQGR